MPDLKPEIRRRLANLKLEPTREAAIIEELAQYLEDCYTELRASGATEAEAYQRTLAELNGCELLSRELRRAERQITPDPIVLGTNRRINMIADLWQDLRFGARMLLKNPGFTLIAVATLSLGIGANTAIFSVVNATLLRPLPYQDPERLLMVWEGANQGSNPSAPANFFDWREQNRVFEGMAVLIPQGYNLTGAGEPERLSGRRVSANLFRLLGVQPALGRDFLPEEDKAGSRRVTILSDGFWRRRFGADPNIIGRTLTLDGQAVTVVGVMPRSFQFLSREVDLWAPAAFSSAEAGKRHDHYIFVVARLKSGVGLQQAQSEMDAIAGRLQRQYPDTNAGLNVFLTPLHEEVVGKIRRGLLVLMAAVGFVLLIAVVNIANLLLAQATTRQKEIAVRAALGAGRFRLMRQLLAESMFLAGLGGIVGLLIAFWGVPLIGAFIPDSFELAREISIDGRALGFTVVILLFTGVAFGLAPAWRLSKPALNELLKEGKSLGGARQRLRSGLVVVEMSLALMLLVGAALLVKSFLRLSNVNLGFQPDSLLTMRMTLPGPKYSEIERRTSFYDRALERVAALPGVKSAAVVSWLPLTFAGGANGFTIEGRPAPPNQSFGAYYRMVSPDYFRTMGIPLLNGRTFTSQDAQNSPPSIVISQSMAQRFWPGEEAIGKQIKMAFAGPTPPTITVIGVVGDARNTGIGSLRQPVMYASYRQEASFPFVAPQDLVVRAVGDPLSLAPAVRNEIWAVDKDLPLSKIQTMEQVLSAVVAQPRFNMLLLSLFAGLALLLAGIGIYGVVSYTVTQRRQEIGVRMALGAQPRNVLKLVLGQGVALALIGVAIGVAGALGLTRLMADMLFGVKATDPLIFIGVSLLLVMVALLACYVPARRATKVDPLIALRSE